MRRRVSLVAAAAVATMLAAAGTAPAAVDQPRNPAPAWFTEDLKQRADAAGLQGVPVDDHGLLDVCPGVVLGEGDVGTGTCLVYPYGCTANFVYYDGNDPVAPATADGSLHLGTAGHCVDRAGQPVYGAVASPGVGAAIVRIGTVTSLIDEYDDDGLVQDFASIRIDAGHAVDPASPVGGPQGIYDGCEPGQALKYYGHGYEVAVAQGKPGGGVAAHWYGDGFGYFGTAFGGDSGSGVLDLADRAVGDLTAVYIFDPSLAFFPGEVVGSRVPWILSFLGPGYSLVNADGTVVRVATTACDREGGGGNSGGGGNGGGNKGGKGKGGGSNAGGNGKGGGRGGGRPS